MTSKIDKPLCRMCQWEPHLPPLLSQHFLALWYFQLLYVDCTVISSRVPWFFLLENRVRKQDAGTQICSWWPVITVRFLVNRQCLYLILPTSSWSFLLFCEIEPIVNVEGSSFLILSLAQSPIPLVKLSIFSVCILPTFPSL